MANFITCWLQDPGDLPPGDGPPGGSGDGGPKDDDEDDQCTGTVTYCYCDGGQDLSYDETTNCNDCHEIPRADVTNNCTTAPPDCYGGPGGGVGVGCTPDHLAETGENNLCEAGCEVDPTDCLGFICEFPPACSQKTIASTKELFDGGGCDQSANPACDITYPCVWGGITYYVNNDACMAADAPPMGPGDCQEFTCPSFVCDVIGCEPGGGMEKGECVGSFVTFDDCPTFFEADGLSCYDNPSNGQSCTLDNIIHYQIERDCEGSDSCTEVLTCDAWECDSESDACDKTGDDGKTSTSSEECCTEVTLSNADGDYCDVGPDGCEGGAGIFNGTGPYYAEKEECEAACIKCPEGYLCEDPDEAGHYGECEKDPACLLIWDSKEQKCEVKEGDEDTCFKLQFQCIETGCECKGFVGCELAIDETNPNPQCILCDPSGYSSEWPKKCLYEDKNKVFADADGNLVLTCQEFHDAYKSNPDGAYIYPIEDEFSKGKAMAECENECISDIVPPCYSCSKPTSCYECEEMLEPIRIEVCVESQEAVNKCQEDSDCVATKDALGAWECVCSPGGYYIDSNCDDACIDCDEHPAGHLYDSADCDNECGLTGGGPPPPEEGYGFYGGKKAYERIYSSDKGNPVYEKYISNIKVQNGVKFVPVRRGDLRGDLFKNKVHVGITATTNINNKIFRFSDNPYSDLSDKNIEKSIHDNIILKLNLARSATGKPLKRMFLSTIRGLIVSNRLDSFNLPQLNELLDRIISVQGEPEYKDTRDYTPLLNLNTIGNEAAAIELATNHIWPLNPDNYFEVRVAERMRTWKTLAPDLQKYLPITTAEGVTTPFYYSISDTITLAGSGTLTLSNGDLQHITLSDGSIGAIPIQSLRDRAGVLSIETLQKLMYLLGDVYDFNLRVTTDQIDRVDERYGLTKARKNIYFLALQPDTITDLERSNPFVARTKATYKYEHTSEARNSIVSTDGSGAAFPCLEVYLDVNDPIFSYIENNGTIDLTSKDFVLDLFNEEDAQNLFIPVIPRRVPQVLAIYASDMTSNVVTHNISKSTSYGVREVNIVMNPNPDRIDTWHPVFLKEELAFPARGIDPSKNDYQSLKYSMDTKDISNQSLFYSGEQPTERIAWGERQVYKLAKEMKDNYQLPTNNNINWYEIYDRMSIPQMKFLHNECFNFERFKSLLSMGKPSSNDTVNAHYPKIKEYRSRSWLGVDNFTDSIDGGVKWLTVKPDHTPIPVEPLD